LEFCLREDLNKSTKSYGGFRSNKISITNYPEDKEEWLEAENNQEDESAGFRKVPFQENYLLKEKTFRRCSCKVFRLSLAENVLKMRISLKVKVL
jgi:glutaminyl-tRNA synthetase